MYLLTICEVSISVFCPFLILGCISFIMDFIGILYIFWNKVLCQINILRIFFLSSWLVSVSFSCSFLSKNLMKTNLSFLKILLFMLFVSCLRKFCLFHDHKGLPCFLPYFQAFTFKSVIGRPTSVLLNFHLKIF